MKQTMLVLLTIITLSVNAQKKLIPVSQSAISGLTLPGGCKTDQRILSTSSARALFNAEYKSYGLNIKSVEVLYIPLAASPAFKEDFFNSSLQQAGWTIKPNNSNKKFYWLQKEGKNVLAYYSVEQKDINLYFANCDVIFNANTQVNGNNNTIQNQQKTDSNTNGPFLAPSRLDDQQNQTAPAASSAYAFTSTNFDDGWTSVEKPDWVEVTKGNIQVLLHYPKEGTIFPADPDPLIRTAWDILVASRYSNLKNFKTTYISTYERPYIGFGEATKNATGQQVYVVLFRQGQTGWIEIVASDKNSFIKNYLVDLDGIKWDSETDLMKPLAKMQNYNKFAIAAADFTGKWADRFSSNTYYTNIYTGNSAGMSTYSSSQSFEFTGNKYTWHLVAVNSYGGQSSFGQGKGNGSFKVLNNWQLYFSEMEGKPKTFDAYFSCTKGSRILWMNDAKSPGSGIYTGFSKQ